MENVLLEANHYVQPIHPVNVPEVKKGSFGRCIKLELAKRMIYSTIMSIFYFNVSLGCAILFLKGYRQKYRSLSEYHFTRAFQPLDVLISYRYRKKIVNFSINATQNTELRTISPHFNQFEILKQNYPEFLQFALAQKIDLKGICLGMSFDFISQFLNRPSHEPEISAIDRISRLYQEGATKNAQILQVIYKSYSLFIGCCMEAHLKERISQKVLEILAVKNDFSELAKKKAIKDPAVEEIVQEFKNEKNNKIYPFLSEITHLNFEKQDSSMTLSNLPAGVYKIQTNTHAMAFFRTQESGFFFDPNIGTLEISEKHFSDLENELTEQYCVDRLEKLTFVKIELPPKNLS